MTRRIYEDYAYSDAPRQDCFWPKPLDIWPELKGGHSFEIVIIGAGYTGLCAALHLAKSGVDVAVIEANTPGWGASGRNGGFCCIGGDKLGLPAIQKKFGHDAATSYFNAQRAAIDHVAALLETHNIDADTHSNGELQLAHRPQAFAGLKTEQDQWTKLGISSTLIPPEDLKDHGLNGNFHGALHVPLGFALNPGKYVNGLAKAVQTAGAQIFTHSPVQSITQQENRHILTTPKSRVTAKKVIVATNGYSTDGLAHGLSGRYLPMQSNVLMTRPLSDDEIAEQGWSSDLMSYDSRNLLHYFRLLPNRRFLFGARANIKSTAAVQTDMHNRLKRDLGALFPAWANVETPNFWSGLISLSFDKLPYTGPIAGSDSMWTSLNYHGNGVAMSSWSGTRLAQMAMGEITSLPVRTRPLKRFPLARFRRNYLYGAMLHYRLKDGPAPK